MAGPGDGDGIGDNSDTFASIANNIVYAAGGMTIGLLGLVGLEMGNRSGIPKIIEGLELGSSQDSAGITSAWIRGNAKPLWQYWTGNSG